MPRTVRRVRTALRGLRGLRGLCPPADELRRSPFHTRLPQATSVPHHHSPSDLHIARVGPPSPPRGIPLALVLLLSPSLFFSVSLLTDAACSRGVRTIYGSPTRHKALPYITSAGRTLLMACFVLHASCGVVLAMRPRCKHYGQCNRIIDIISM